jgi:hypothetical protein
MEARTSKGERGSSRANKGDKYWLGVSIKMEKAFPKRGIHSRIEHITTYSPLPFFSFFFEIMILSYLTTS